MPSTVKEEPKKRGKYGRPCDRCASKRIRCVPVQDSKSCKGCTNLNIECTQNRIRLKSGPKRIKGERVVRGTVEKIKQEHSGVSAPLPMFPLELSDNLRTKSLPTLLFDAMGDLLTAGGGVFAHSRNGISTNAKIIMGNTIPSTAAAAREADVASSVGVDVAAAAAAAAATASATDPNDIFDVFQTSSVHTSKFSVEHLLPRLQVYQTWFYGSWPVLSVAELILTISDGTQMRYDKNTIRLTEQNAMLYALCCSVCAAITTQISFVSDKDSVLDYNTFSASEYADEARRVRNLFDFSAHPNVQILLSSFFLYCHYVNNKGKTLQAIIYLREAITIAQILGFHEEASYVGKTRAEIHRWRKIYYTLLVTERFMCFEDGMPVVLEPCIAFPNLDDEEYPSLLVGFTELIRVFSVPSKEFFAEIALKGAKNTKVEGTIAEKKERIFSVQEKLWNITLGIRKIANSQKLDVLLSRSWIRALAWHITSENGLVVAGNDANDCFDLQFPVTIARDFLAQTVDLPMFAFEANGPGVCIKLLEIATSVALTFQKGSPPVSTLNVLESLFQIITKCENDVTLPLDLYHKIGNVIAYFKTRTIPRLTPSPNEFRGLYIEELADEVDEAAADHIDADLQPPVGFVAPPILMATPILKGFDLQHAFDALDGTLGDTPLSEFRESADPYHFAMAEMRRSGKLSAASSNTSLNNMMNMIMSQTPQAFEKCGGSMEEFLAGVSGKSGSFVISETQ